MLQACSTLTVQLHVLTKGCALCLETAICVGSTDSRTATSLRCLELTLATEVVRVPD